MCDDNRRIRWDDVPAPPGIARFTTWKPLDRRLQARLAARHATYLRRKAEREAAAAQASGPGDERGRVGEAAGDVGEEL